MGEYLFLGCATLSIANGAVLLWINPRRTVNQAFFLCCVCMCLWCLCVTIAIKIGHENPVPVQPLNFWLRTSSSVGAFACWLIWLTKTALIHRELTAKAILRRSWPWLAVSCAIAGVAFSESFIPSTATPETKERGFGYSAYFAVIAICCTYFLIDALRRGRELSGIRKIELRYFVVNATIACILVVLAHAISLYVDIGWLRRSGLVSFTLLNCAAVWAICHHRVFDAKHLVFSIGQRAILLGSLGLLTLAIWFSLQGKFSTLWSLFVASTTAITAGILCDPPIRRWLKLDPAEILIAPRKTIIDFSREISNEETLKIKFSEFLRNWCQTNAAVLWAVDDEPLPNSQLSLRESWPGFVYLAKNGWATPEALQRSKPESGTSEITDFLSRNNFGVLLAAPKGSNPPSLVVCLGQKESLRPYTFPDIDILLGLVELMDNILTHSRAAANAAQIERMETAAIMSRGLAHDLSNLATPVSTFLIHMENHVAAGTPEAAVLADAKFSIGVMQKYIHESLFFTRTLIPKIEPIEVRQLFASVARLCNDRAKVHEANIVTQFDNSFSFSADLALMQRLLQNLTLNALDASPKGSEIILRALHTDDDRVSFEVRDRGTGIAPGIIDRIFEPYFTTKEGGSTLRGLGLGLAICRKIVDLHSGSISVTCDIQSGTVFKVILPVTPKSASQLPAAHFVDEPTDPVDFRQQPQPI